MLQMSHRNGVAVKLLVVAIIMQARHTNAHAKCKLLDAHMSSLAARAAFRCMALPQALQGFRV